MAIVKLDKHTAELIAAGEVVERPASVVKELVENAIDAGAHTVEVEIAGGGITLLRVADDGCGIEAEDLPLAFVRHATSKLKTADDLEAIHTLGFRGEALASIASVARVELLTKNDIDEFASVAAVAGGGAPQAEVAARPRGTTVTVRDLFYNTPARMKFLKKDASEGTFVTETVTRLALSHPEVAFRYIREGKPAFATPGDGSLESAVWAVLGKDFARGLLTVDSAAGALQVRGLITSPLAGRGSRSMQFFFINGRFVKNRTMMAALEQAYRGMAMQGRFPGAVLFLQMPPHLVDVNVHPAKTEVRFAREGDVFDAVYRAVKAALLDGMGSHAALQLDVAGKGDASGVPHAAGLEASEELPFTFKEKPGASAGPARPMPGQAAAPRAERPAAAQVQAYNHLLEDTAKAADTLESGAGFIPYETRHRPVPPPAGAGWAPPAKTPVPMPADGPTVPFEATDAPPAQQDVLEAPAPAQQTTMEPETSDAAPPLRLIGEVFRTYILAEAGEVLCLIDKHAAHERLLYEKIAEEVAGGDPPVQQLLAPVAVPLGAAEKNALLENEAVLRAAGIEAEDFGAGSMLVRGVPADIEPGDIEALVAEVGARLAVNPRDTRDEKAQWVLHSIACRAAVKAGDSTPPAALLGLARQIMGGVVPPFCPHGRPVVIELTRKELEKQFGRLG